MAVDIAHNHWQLGEKYASKGSYLEALLHFQRAKSIVDPSLDISRKYIECTNKIAGILHNNPVLTLQLKRGFTKKDVRKAYKRFILIYHPDKNSDCDTSIIFTAIQAAYEQLMLSAPAESSTKSSPPIQSTTTSTTNTNTWQSKGATTTTSKVNIGTNSHEELKRNSMYKSPISVQSPLSSAPIFEPKPTKFSDHTSATTSYTFIPRDKINTTSTKNSNYLHPDTTRTSSNANTSNLPTSNPSIPARRKSEAAAADSSTSSSSPASYFSQIRQEAQDSLSHILTTEELRMKVKLLCTINKDRDLEKDIKLMNRGELLRIYLSKQVTGELYNHHDSSKGKADVVSESNTNYIPSFIASFGEESKEQNHKNNMNNKHNNNNNNNSGIDHSENKYMSKWMDAIKGIIGDHEDEIIKKENDSKRSKRRDYASFQYKQQQQQQRNMQSESTVDDTIAIKMNKVEGIKNVGLATVKGQDGLSHSPSKSSHIIANELALQLPFMSVSELRRTLIANSISLDGCIEKADLQRKLREHFDIAVPPVITVIDQSVDKKSSELPPKSSPVATAEVRSTVSAEISESSSHLSGLSSSLSSSKISSSAASIMTTARYKAWQQKIGSKPVRSMSTRPSLSTNNVNINNNSARNNRISATSSSSNIGHKQEHDEQTTISPTEDMVAATDVLPHTTGYNVRATSSGTNTGSNLSNINTQPGTISMYLISDDDNDSSDDSDDDTVEEEDGDDRVKNLTARFLSPRSHFVNKMRGTTNAYYEEEEEEEGSLSTSLSFTKIQQTETDAAALQEEVNFWLQK